MFHVAGFLPYYQHDQQQVERKRHIGNDVVVLVFKENSKYKINNNNLNNNIKNDNNDNNLNNNLNNNNDGNNIDINNEDFNKRTLFNPLNIKSQFNRLFFYLI